MFAWTLLTAAIWSSAREYQENDSTHAFSSNNNDYNINYYYSWALFGLFLDTRYSRRRQALLLNFFKWSQTTQRPRPFYPTFDSTPNGTGTPAIPTPHLANCNLYTNKLGTDQWSSANPFFVYAYCESTCYTPDQSLRFSTGDMNILDAFKARRDDVVTLSPDATLGDPRTQYPAYTTTRPRSGTRSCPSTS